MSDYILKIGLDSSKDVDTVKNIFKDFGVKKKEIDQLSTTKNSRSGLNINKKHKGEYLALRLGVFGIGVGLLAYFYALIKSSSKDIIGTMLSIRLDNLSVTVLVAGLVFTIIGYLVGKNHPLYTLSSSTDESVGKYLISVKVDQKTLSKVKKKLLKENVVDIDTIDIKKEVELGVRNQ